MRNNRSLAMLSALILIGMIMISSTSNGGIGMVDRDSTRMAGADLIVENETVILDENEEFSSIEIRDNGHLQVSGVMIQCERFICRDDRSNTSFIAIGAENNAFIRITKGIMNVKADHIAMDSCILTIDNTNTSNGYDSSAVLVSLKNDLRITGTTITVAGQDGKAGDKQNYGYIGGNAHLTLQSVNGSISITDSDIEALGGKGGDNLNPGMRGGDGGEANIRLLGDIISIDNVLDLKGQGGNAGSSALQSVKNGSGKISFESTNDMTISRSEIKAICGPIALEEGSSIDFKSAHGSLLVDVEKEGNDRFESLSKMRARTIRIDTASGELHEVDTGDAIPESMGGPVRSYWWANISVVEVYGNLIGKTNVCWYQGSDPNPYPRGGKTVMTDDEGFLSIELPGTIDGSQIKYRFRAIAFGGPSAVSSEITFQDAMTGKGTNRDVTINLSVIAIHVIRINGFGYYESMSVKGSILIEGNARSESTRMIQNISLYEDGSFLATDPAFTVENFNTAWDIRIDIEEYPIGLHSLEIRVMDSNYTISSFFTFYYNGSSIDPKKDIVYSGLGLVVKEGETAIYGIDDVFHALSGRSLSVKVIYGPDLDVSIEGSIIVIRAKSDAGNLDWVLFTLFDGGYNETFNLTVEIQQLNRVPSILNVSWTGDGSSYQYLSVLYKDPENDPVNITWTLGSIVLGHGENLRISLPPGKYYINVTITDPDGLISQAMIPIEVKRTNGNEGKGYDAYTLLTIIAFMGVLVLIITFLLVFRSIRKRRFISEGTGVSRDTPTRNDFLSIRSGRLESDIMSQSVSGMIEAEYRDETGHLIKHDLSHLRQNIKDLKAAGELSDKDLARLIVIMDRIEE